MSEAPAPAPGRKEIAEQLDYKAENFASPFYRFTRIVPLSGSQSVIIPAGSTAETLMELPTQVFNLSESVLNANVEYVTQTNWSWIYLDGMPLISQVDLLTRSGIYLCSIPNFQNYMKVVRKIFTEREEYENNDMSTFLFPSNTLNNAPPAITPNNGRASVNYLESAYVASNANFGQAINTTVNLTLNMKLGAIKKSIFAMNKNIVLPDIIILRILWGPGNKALYGGTSSVDPTAGAVAAIDTNASAILANTNAAVTITNLQLYLAVEKNEDLAQATRALVNQPQGLNLLIDFPYVYKQPNSGTAQNISLRFNRGHGKNLLAVINSVFNSTERANTAYDNFNVANAATAVQTATGAKVVSYNTLLDNVKLQDILLVCGNQNLDDWRENRKFLKDTPYLNSQVYQNNWFHMDNFVLPNKHKADENRDMGISLVLERKWDYQATTISQQYNHYTFALLQKDLHIGRDSISFQ